MKTAIVTGASTGIGQAVAIELSKNGFEVFLVARNEDGLQKTKQFIEKEGGKTQLFVADLSSVESINGLISSVKENTQHVDLIANIAGIWHGKKDVYAGKDFQTFDQQVILDTFTVGTIAPSLLVHGLLPLMYKGGKIINLSGTFENGGKGWLPYFVSKRSIEDFTVGLAQELDEKGIQVNCVSPSDTATDSYAKFFSEFMKDAVHPQEIAKKFAELSNPQNTTTGKIFVIKKGQEPLESFHY